MSLGLFKPQNLSLLRELVITDFKLRYQGSVLGYLWSLLKPMMLFGVLYVVFTRVFRIGGQVPHYPTYLLLGLVLWIFFVEATNMAMGSIVARGDLIRKVSMPRYIIVLSTIFSAFINLCFNLVVVLLFMVITGVEFSINGLWLVPILVELILFALAAAYLLAALFVRFRDLTHIWEVVLQLMFYATPILYPLTFVPHRMAQILSLNPMAQIIQSAREVLITPATITSPEILPYGAGWWAPLSILLATALLAGLYFKKSSKDFAENL